MSDRDDGGPAFAHGDPTHGGDPGMSLRDYFAGQASEEDVQAHYLAAGSSRERAKYAHADAMLEAR